MAIDPPSLTRKNISQSSAEIFIQGEKKTLKLKLHTYDDEGEIEVPSDIVATNLTADFYSTTDKLTTLLFSDVPTQSDITNDLGDKTGVELSLVVDTTDTNIDDVGYYVVVFNYTLNGVENRKTPIYFNVVSVFNPLLPE